MSWLQRLYQTHEEVNKNEDLQAQDNRLRPFYHVSQNIQIIVTIDDKSNFIRAELCRDDMGKVKSKNFTIPASNESANRTSGAVAHPLSDKLQYLAKCFHDFSNSSKKDCYPLYEQALSAWCHSEFAHPKAQAVLSYVQKGTIIQDLLNDNILIADPENPELLAYPEQARDYPDSLLSSLIKNGAVFDQGSAFIAWRVVSSDLENMLEHGVSETWLNETLFESWQQFYASLDSADGFCYITGKVSALASKHPKGILRGANNAKLISANDLNGFTFLGRFTDTARSIKENGLQGANISALVTEKAHAALSWLLGRQGREEAGQAVVAWASSGRETLQPTEQNREIGAFDVEREIEEFKRESSNSVERNSFSFDDDDDFDDIEFEEDVSDELDDKEVNELEVQHVVKHLNNLGYSFAKHLTNTLQGYRQKLEANEQISVITLDSATPGRMAVTYYHESMPDDYIDALDVWYRQFSWYFSYTDADKQRKLTMTAPIPKQIAQVAYGSRLSDALKKQVLSQVLPCIVEGEKRQFPWQLVDLCIKRACNPLVLENWEWELAICVACALYRGYHLRHSTQKRSYTVALQTEYNSRDYLYGRLLAVAEDIESLALYISGEKRNTTAQRYMQQFANRPFTTWRNIELALKPYENRLKSSYGGYLNGMQSLIDQIMILFEISDFNNDSALSGEFLLGYHSQKMQIKLDKKQAKVARENIDV